MRMVLEIKEQSFVIPSQQSYSTIRQTPPSIPSSQSTAYKLSNRISPSILLIIIIVAVIFFISGLLHLLVRFLLRPALIRNSDEIDDLTALEGQLQQLFHLHDSGVDQSFVDALPVFNYKAIVGVKDPFDCAVCLSEFEVEDKLRLLPKCSHAFHMDCIDTWLLSHSTCPICRASLVQDFSQNSGFSPVVRVLESGSENSREIALEREVNTHLSDDGDGDDDDDDDDLGQKSGEIGVREREKVVAVKLGKFRNVGGGEGGGGESSAEARRCFSMGSFAYVLDENLSLRVGIANMKKKSFKKRGLGHKTAMSECGCDSRREFNGFEAFKVLQLQCVGDENKSISSMSKRDSFSLSKIWLSGRKDRSSAASMESTRRAFSFRLPAAGDTKSGDGRGGELNIV